MDPDGRRSPGLLSLPKEHQVMAFDRSRRSRGNGHTRAARIAVLVTFMVSMAAVVMKVIPA